jgi:hypothetical protein
MVLTRRKLLGQVATAAVRPIIPSPAVQTSEWGSSVFGLHFHDARKRNREPRASRRRRHRQGQSADARGEITTVFVA